MGWANWQAWDLGMRLGLLGVLGMGIAKKAQPLLMTMMMMMIFTCAMRMEMEMGRAFCTVD